jgi:two-component system, NarL family, response regulator LiaR
MKKIPLPEPANLQSSALRILIVEDDPLMRLGLKQFLETDARFAIAGEVADGYSAIDAAAKLTPDLVIMDIGLPQLDGIEATRQIKAKFPTVRILMLTSHEEEMEMIAALSCGADAYCIKGTSLQQLSIAIAAVQDGAVYLAPQIARTAITHLQCQRPNLSQVQLSRREVEILKFIVEGQSNPEIAQTLHLSLSTVKTHVRNIMNKLAVDDRVQAAVIALRSGLV